MAVFAPYGLRSLYSHSNSSLAQSGVEEFPFPTTGGWFGFAGDVACLNFLVPTDPASPTVNTYTPLVPKGFVYPYPTGVITTVYAPIVGVFEGFKYTPLGQPGLIKESTNFIPGTPIQPGTQVMAVVRVDLQGVFQIQAAAFDGIDGTIYQNDVLTKAPLLCVNTYQVTVPDVPNTPSPNPVNALNFPLGNTGENGMSGLFFECGYDLDGNDSKGQSLGIHTPCRLIGCVNPDDYSVIGNFKYNPQVKVRIDGLNTQSFVIVQPLT